MTNAIESANVHFKKLSLDEKHSKLGQLSRSKTNRLTIWEKGATEKFHLVPTAYYRSKSDVEVTGRYPSEFIGKKLLITFELSGLHFFGAGQLSTMTKDRVFINLTDIFKSERRANFRLLTYPHQEVYIHIKVPQFSKNASNLVSLKTGLNETGLFTNFLDMLADDKKETIREGYLRLRVIDISVTGLAVQFGQIESGMFDDSEVELSKMYLEFNEKVIEIPNGKILYKLDFLARDRKTKLFKGGLKFLDVGINLDEELSQILNEALRSLESEFEDFLK